MSAAVMLGAPASADAQLLPSPITHEPATPDLIDEAEERGRIDLERASLYRAYALSGDPRLPDAYESTRPWRGTLVDLELRRDLPKLDPGFERREVTQALRAPDDPNPTQCSAFAAPLLDSIETEHFYVQYNATVPIGGGLTVQDYADSLEEAFDSEVTSYEWAEPPQSADGETDIPGQYHVRVEPLGAGLYGLVSSGGTYAGTADESTHPAGDNPDTAWNEGDASASCMVLNSDFETGFPGTAQQALDATTAHEYNHSIQFGYGALDSESDEIYPDDVFVEGGATWMEDEVQDGSNDNYNYLYPEFDDSMGEHDEGDIYAYWLTWRGLTEPAGTNAPGAGEDIMQDFWERTSREESGNLEAMDLALAAERGTNLPEAYHAYAVAAKFMQTCAGAYVLPYCFEEAAGYRTTPSQAPRGEPDPHGEVSGVNQFFKGQVEDNYTLNWVVLPANAGSYDVSLSNDSSGGTMRGTVACDTGTTITQSALPSTVGAGEAQTTPAFDSDGCQQVVAVVTNETQTAPNPDSSEARDYTVSTATPAETARPDTTITSGPSGTSGSSTATFTFASSEAGSGFECRYDGAAFAPCSSPNTRSGLANGQHTFEVRATDAAGNTDLTPASRTFTVNLDTTVPDIIAPALDRVRLSSRRFRAARVGRAISAAPLGTRVSYRLSEAATVRVRYERRVTGRRVGGRCRAVSLRNRGRERCLRFGLVRGLARRRGGTAGANSFRLTGRMNGRALRPGVYRLRLSARDGAGNASGTRRSGSFRIVRR